MSSVLFVADVHLGNHQRFGGVTHSGINARARFVLDALERAADAANDNDAALAVLGDLFDVSRPAPQLIAAARRILCSVKRGVVLLVGNHDQDSTALGDHALCALEEGPQDTDTLEPGCVVIVERPRVLRIRGMDRPGLFLPYAPGDSGAYITDTIRDARGADVEFVAFHAGVRDGRTPHYLRAAHDAIDVDVLAQSLRDADIRLAFCGNWHNPRAWEILDGRLVVQVGTLAPTGFDNADIEGRGIHFFPKRPTVACEPVSIPGPRFHTVAFSEGRIRVPKRRAGDAVFLRVRCAPGEEELAQAAANDTPDLAGWTVEPETPDTERPTIDAAAVSAVRDEQTLDRAIREYVAKAPFDDGVSRETVLERVLSHLAQGGSL